MLSWRAKRQLIALLVIAIPFALVAFWAIGRIIPAPSCTDNAKNQEETGVDCGGPCAPCELRYPKPVTVFWTRIVPVTTDAYDAAAEIENSNENLSSAVVEYEFELQDELGPVAFRSGKTFLLAQEKIHVIESNIKTSREPQRVVFKIKTVEWQLRKETKPTLVVERRDYKVRKDANKTRGLIETSIFNRSPLNFKDTEVRAIVLDPDGNLLGANKVIIDKFLSGTREVVVLIWPEELKGEIVSIIIEPRVNTLDLGTILAPE